MSKELQDFRSVHVTNNSSVISQLLNLLTKTLIQKVVTNPTTFSHLSLLHSLTTYLLKMYFNNARTVLGPTQPPIQWIAGALPLGVKWQGHEADHSPPSSAEAKE